MTIKTKNLYKLITKEDHFNLHKILGLSSLCNFLYQFSHLFMYGEMNLKKNTFTPILLCIHSFLSLSSIIFRVPFKRQLTLPTINKEIRLHSITFAIRSIICCYLFYNNYDKIYNIFIINLTMIVADVITYFYFTNTSTMRNMAFNKEYPEVERNKITKMHSGSQFSATIYMMINIDTAFSPLLAIQLAVFLMTLSRKSIIDQLCWQRVYTISLWINIFLLWEINSVIDYSFIILGSYIISNIRMKYRINKYVLWNIPLVSYYYLWKNKYDIEIDTFFHPILIITTIFIYLIKNIRISHSLWKNKEYHKTIYGKDLKE